MENFQSANYSIEAGEALPLSQDAGGLLVVLGRSLPLLTVAINAHGSNLLHKLAGFLPSWATLRAREVQEVLPQGIGFLEVGLECLGLLGLDVPRSVLETLQPCLQ